MRAKHRFLRRVGDVLAFVVTIAIGVAMGGVLGLADTIDEQFTAAKKKSAVHTKVQG